MLPILHFTYADPKGDLNNIKRERKSHYDLMVPRFLKGDYAFFQNQDFNQNDLDFGFREYLNRITIFHFSGHAGMGEIQLQSGASYIEGIAKQMKRALSDEPLPQLVLVFLNGCSTGSMVNDLLNADVPIVIGTSAPVGDSMAADFSINFYEALIKGNSIKEAFDIAESILLTRNNDINIFRGLCIDELEKKEPIWGIFYAKDKGHLLNWKILNVRFKSLANESCYEINNKFKVALYYSLLNAGLPKIKFLEDQRIMDNKDIREEISSAILLGYPGPISYSIAEMLNIEVNNPDKKKEELYPIHLQNLYSLYQSITELLFLIMISQLWETCLGVNNDGKKYNEKPMLPADYRDIADQLEIIKDFFQKSRKDRKFLDYMPKILAIQEIFAAAGKRYFVDELDQFKSDLVTDKILKECCDFFNSLRNNIQTQSFLHFDTDTWKEKCESGEKFLAYLFDKLSFCTHYDFGILKNIELCLTRFQCEPTYTYRLLKIPKNGSLTYLSFSPNMSGFTSVKSIVMLKAENFKDNTEVQLLTGQINLSPFMLDFNVADQKAVKGNLLIYSHYDKLTRSYLFDEALRNNSEKFIKPGESIYKEVNETINVLVQVLFRENIDSLSQ